MEKVVIIGPVYPYKGGIAHYTSIIYKELAKKYSVSMISFKRQYPKFIYPGKEQKDFKDERFKVNATFLIDTLNPFTWINTVRVIKNVAPDLVIFQWWNPYFAFSYSFIAFCLKRFTGLKLLFLCHNVIPHERIPFDAFLTKLTLRMSDLYIVHSEEDRDNLLKLLPGAQVTKAFHPTYSVFNCEGLTKQDARDRLKIYSGNVILFFGFIREYKGLRCLVKAMPEIVKHMPDIALLIVGDFYEDKESYIELIEELGISENIIIVDGYIPDNEVGTYFSAADLVVLPYISATQSGIIQIAYGFNKPVISTNVGGLAEVVIDNKTGYIIDSGSEMEIADSVIKFYKEDKEAEFIRNIIEEKDKYSWDRLVDHIECLMEGK